VNWLKKNEILGNDSFRMYLPSGTAVVFDKPNNELGYCQINKMEMCANYTVNNAEISTNFGIGVPV